MQNPGCNLGIPSQQRHKLLFLLQRVVCSCLKQRFNLLFSAAISAASCSQQKLTCVVGVNAGPAKADPGDGVIKLADGPALGSHVRPPLAPEALKEVGVFVEVAPQVEPQTEIVDASEAGVEVPVSQHLRSAAA